MFSKLFTYILFGITKMMCPCPILPNFVFRVASWQLEISYNECLQYENLQTLQIKNFRHRAGC